VVCAQRRKRGHLPISNQSVIDLGESKNSGGLAAIPLGRSETNGYDHCKTPRDPGENRDLRHFFSDHQPLRYIYNLDGYVFLLRVLVFFPGIQNHTHPITNKKKLFKKTIGLRVRPSQLRQLHPTKRSKNFRASWKN
jgi:hypothetical protein